MAARGASGDANLAAIVRERSDLVMEWQAKDQLLDAALSQPSERRDKATEKALRDRRSAIDARLAAIDARLKDDFPEYATLVSPEPLTIGELQGRATSTSPALLHDDETLVLFLDTPKEKPATEATFIWVVTQTDAKWFRSGLGTQALTDRVQALRCGLDDAEWEGIEKPARCAKLIGVDTRPGDMDPLPFSLAIAHELYQALLSPVEDVIKDKRLLIVPSGPLT